VCHRERPSPSPGASGAHAKWTTCESALSFDPHHGYRISLRRPVARRLRRRLELVESHLSWSWRISRFDQPTFSIVERFVTRCAVTVTAQGDQTGERSAVTVEADGGGPELVEHDHREHDGRGSRSGAWILPMSAEVRR
jgi:hypothetical protein